MIKAELGLDISNFQGGLKRATQSMRDVDKGGGFLSGITTTWTDLGNIAQTVSQVVSSAFKGIYGAMEEGGALVDLAEQTGVSIERLSVLKVAFQQAGMAAEDVQGVVNKMQKSIAQAGTGSGDAALAFRDLGLNIKDLGAMDAEAQLAAIGEAVARIDNPTKKAAMAMQIFGKSGGRLLAMFGAGGLAGAEKVVGSQAQLLADNAEVFDRTTDVLGQTGTKLRGLFVGMASVLAPAAQEFVDAFEELDLAETGKEFANAFLTVASAVKDVASLLSPLIKGASELIDKSAAATKGTGSTYQAGAFMGMGGMGFAGGGVSQQEARTTVEAQTPKEAPKPGEADFIGPMPETLSQRMKRQFAGGFELPTKPEAPPSAIVGELARAGGGGNVFGGGATSSALLETNRQQVGLLQRIATAVERTTQSAVASMVPTTTPTLGVYA
jgi:hypothetical protein